MGVQMQAVAAVASIASARSAQRAYANDAQAAYEQQQMAEIESKQAEVNRLRELRSQLSSLDTDFAGRGVATGSPTVSNLGRMEKKFAEADISSIKLMGSSKRRQFGLKQSSSKQLGKVALLSGVTKATGYAAESYMGATGKTSLS